MRFLNIKAIRRFFIKMESNLIKNREERNWGDLPMIQSDT